MPGVPDPAIRGWGELLHNPVLEHVHVLRNRQNRSPRMLRAVKGPTLRLSELAVLLVKNQDRLAPFLRLRLLAPNLSFVNDSETGVTSLTK